MSAGPLRRVRSAWEAVRPFLAASRGRIPILILCSTAAGFAEAGLLVLVVRIALTISNAQEAATVDLGPVHGLQLTVGTMILAAVALSAFRLALQFVQAWLPPRMSTEAAARLRNEIFSGYIDATWELQSREREGHMQELMTGQITRGVQTVLVVTDGLGHLLNFTALALSAVVVSPLAAGSIFIAVTALFFGLRPLSKRTRRYADRRAAATLEYAASLNEVVRLTEEVRVFAVADALRRRVRTTVEGIREPSFRTQFLANAASGLYQNLAILLVIGGLALLHSSQTAQLASLGAVVLILVRALTYAQGLQATYNRLNDLVPDMRRVRAAETLYARHREPSGDETLERIEQISFTEVDFAYVPGRPVLRRVSFDLSMGETVGIVGPSGAGKSTFVQLLLRLRDPDDGAYLVNGTPARAYSSESWFRRIAYVPQEPRLVAGTVAENIRFYRPFLTQDDIEAAARAAGIHEEILGWPLRYDTIIGQRADAVSGGQRQRICLARALAHRPDLIILDEPTSALDVHSEAKVQESLTRIKGDVILLIVAHRLSTLNTCDRIMVFGDGRLEAFDSAANLLGSNTFYRTAVELSKLS